MSARWKFVLAVVCALGMATGATWVLAHGGDAGLIHACVNNDSGTLRIVGPDQNCKSNETPLDWGGSGGGAAAGQLALKGYVDGFGNSYCAAPWGIVYTGCGLENQTPVTTDLTVTALAVQPHDNYSGGTVTLLVNGQPTDLVATLAAGSTEVVIAHGSVPVSAGDTLTAQGDCGCTDAPGFFFNGTLEYR